MKVCPLHRAVLHFIQSFIIGMSTKGKKMQLNHSDSIIYSCKSLEWNEISYFSSYWKRSSVIIGSIIGRALGGHLLHPSLLAGSATSLWFLTDVYLNCSQHLLQICSAPGAENSFSFSQTIHFLQSQIQAENPALPCVLQQFCSSSSHIFVAGKGERKSASPSTICCPKQLSVLPLPGTGFYFYLFLHFLY